MIYNHLTRFFVRHQPASQRPAPPGSHSYLYHLYDPSTYW